MVQNVLKVAYSEDGVSIPADFVRADYIKVFGDDVAVTDFTIENDGTGGRVLTTKDLFTDLCIIYQPEVDLVLTKFNSGILGTLNSYFARVAARIALLQSQVDGDFLTGWAARIAALEILPAAMTAQSTLVTSLSDQLATLQSSHEALERAVMNGFTDAGDKIKRVTLSKVRPAVLNPDVFYELPKFPIETAQFDWPTEPNRFSKCEPARLNIHCKPKGFCIFDFCKSDMPWKSDILTLVCDTPKPFKEFAL